MPLPYRFLSGQVARSAQVNANFDYLISIIGSKAGPGTLAPSDRILLGPRDNANYSSQHDTGSSTTAFTQIAWNVKWEKVGTAWKFIRHTATLNASAIRVGMRGFEVLLTNLKSGDLNAQMQTVFRVGVEDAGKFLYIPDDLPISTTNGLPTTLQQRRLTTVLLENPVPIYANTAVGTGISVLNASDYGVPRYAQAVVIRAHVTAANNSGAGMHFYREMGSGSQGINMFRGFVAHAPITGTGMGMRSGAQGIVPLGRGAHQGKFVVQRTAPFELANVHIVGYLT